MEPPAFTKQLQKFINQPRDTPKIKLTSYLQEAKAQQTPKFPNKTTTTLLADFSKMIFSSNFIEYAGLYNLPPETTANICSSVFNNTTWSPETSQSDLPSKQYSEVVQHAQAFKFLVEKLVFQNETFSEELFLKAHKILHNGIMHSDGEDIAGLIRTEYSAARSGASQKTVVFPPPRGIPALMKSLFSDLNTSLTHASKIGEIDPYDLAARYCHRFVNIHPFSDGNGRVCRLLLNTLLLKYAGHVVYFGGDEGGREEYLGIAHKGAKESRREDYDDLEEGERIGHRKLAELVLRSSREQEVEDGQGRISDDY